MYTERFSEAHVILAQHDPRVRQVATHVSGWVSMENYHRAVLHLKVGNMGNAATLDADIQQASDSTGTGAKAITGKSITQLTQAGGNGNDRVVIEFQSEELNVTAGFRWVRAQITIAGNTVFCDAHIKRFQAGHSPVSVAALTEVID